MSLPPAARGAAHRHLTRVDAQRQAVRLDPIRPQHQLPLGVVGADRAHLACIDLELPGQPGLAHGPVESPGKVGRPGSTLPGEGDQQRRQIDPLGAHLELQGAISRHRAGRGQPPARVCRLQRAQVENALLVIQPCRHSVEVGRVKGWLGKMDRRPGMQVLGSPTDREERLSGPIQLCAGRHAGQIGQVDLARLPGHVDARWPWHELRPTGRRQPAPARLTRGYPV